MEVLERMRVALLCHSQLLIRLARVRVPDGSPIKLGASSASEAAPFVSIRWSTLDPQFGHIDAELQELTMDSRGAPERVRGGQACNEGLDLGGDGRATPDRPGGE